MLIKELIVEDFNSYMYPTTTVRLPSGDPDEVPLFPMPDNGIIELFVYNNKTKALVIKNFAPLNSSSFDEIIELLRKLRVEYKQKDSLFILYTDYDKKDIEDKLLALRSYVGPVIVKFGQYDPTYPPKMDSVLGIMLSSSNQYAERIC